MTRRGLFKTIAAAVGSAMGVMLAWPMIGYVLGAVFRVPKAQFMKIATLADLPEGKPVQVRFHMELRDDVLHGETLREVWVIRHSDTKVTVFSPICTHLGCRFNWFKAAKKFICPCHGSVFALDGKVLGGPAPRGLDRLPYKIENGELYVKWERFEVGTEQKIRVG